MRGFPWGARASHILRHISRFVVTYLTVIFNISNQLSCHLENDIVGEALVALKHEELKDMGISSVGHRLTILKSVYETKVKQGIPIDPDHYVPLCTYHVHPIPQIPN